MPKILPAAQSPAPVTTKVDSWRFTTTNTKQAAAFATVELPLKLSDPVTNVHDKDHPVRGGAPGVVTYHFEASTPSGIEVQDLVTAWEQRTADTELDAAIGALAATIETMPPSAVRDLLTQQVEQIRTLIPLAVVCYIRGGLENRERLIDLIKQATPMVMIQRGQQTLLVSKNPPAHVRQRFGI